MRMMITNFGALTGALFLSACGDARYSPAPPASAPITAVNGAAAPVAVGGALSSSKYRLNFELSGGGRGSAAAGGFSIVERTAEVAR